MLTPAVCLAPHGCWVEVADLREGTSRAILERWLQAQAGLPRKIAKALSDAAWQLLQQSEHGDTDSEDGEPREGDPCEDELQKGLLALLDDYKVRRSRRSAPGQLVLQPGAERRRTSSHYTPRSLSEPLVRRTLEPLLAVLGEQPSSEQLLSLTVCDPAMGSGAFLVEACRFLGKQLEEAWRREGQLPELTAQHMDPAVHARRLVAQRCLYGVDKNRFAVDLAKLSLWLVTLASDLPFTFLDHALRWGDSLVGMSFEQIRGFHWRPEAQRDLCSEALDEVLEVAVQARQRIQQLAAEDTPADRREQEYLLEDAESALARARLLGDLVVGAFFAAESPKAREQELNRRWTLIRPWLESGDAPPPALQRELDAMQAELHARVPTFHWMLEFPEVFYAERPDPLVNVSAPGSSGRRRVAFLEALVGNPPFAGKNAITANGGTNYLKWLQEIHAGSHGNADLSAHFFRRADTLLGDHGVLGLIATNTIAQGDTRASGLQPLVQAGHRIFAAETSFQWPGDANVAVSVVHMAKGRPADQIGDCQLDGEPVAVINSRLRPTPERPDPVRLQANAGLSFQGSIVLGMGFALTPAERQDLIERDARNAECIFPYLGGKELNNDPQQRHERYVINFGDRSLEAAEQWPQLLQIVREKVKPERDRLRDNPDGRRRKKFWWHFGRSTPSLAEAVKSLGRCLANSRVSKHLIFAFQPTDRVFAETLYIYPFEGYSPFAVLQSRVHEPWARLLSSSMRGDLRYAASDCFEPFPFPHPDPREELAELADVGRRLDAARGELCRQQSQGLTELYNALKDERQHEPALMELRRLHEELDQAVLTAYGWHDLQVPAYALSDAAAVQVFTNEVLDRLFQLNAERAAAERTAAAGTPRRRATRATTQQRKLF